MDDIHMVTRRARRLAAARALALVAFALAPLVALVAFVVLVAAPSPALAKAKAQGKARVVIAVFSGPASVAKQARLEVIRALGGRYDLVPVAAMAKAERKAGAPESDADYSALASAIGADAIVTGAVTRGRKGYEITIKVRTGADGDVAGEASVTARRGRLGAADKRALKRELSAAMDAFDDRHQRLAKAERDKAERKAAKGGKRGVQAKRSKGDEGDGAGPDGAGDAGGAEDAELGASGRATASAGLRGGVRVGGMFASRTLGFELSDDIPAGMEPFEYDAGLAAGVEIAGELYPLHGALSRMAVTALLARTIQHESVLGELRFPTAQTQIGVGAQWTQPLGSGPSPLAIAIGASVERLSHTIDTGDVMIGLPDVTYYYVGVGGGVQVPVRDKLAVRAAGRYLLGLAAGDIADDANFGGGGIAGFDADAGVAWQALSAIEVRAGVRLLQMGIGFDGTGALSELDADAEPEVESSSDLYFGGYVTAGYRF